MKWSEQMRVLNSEDEHYNQLMFDITEKALFINGKKICNCDYEDAESNEQTMLYTVHYYDSNEFLKKYPFFTDEKFLLNCIFINNLGDEKIFTRAIQITYFDNFIEIYGIYPGGKQVILSIYIKPEM